MTSVSSRPQELLHFPSSARERRDDYQQEDALCLLVWFSRELTAIFFHSRWLLSSSTPFCLTAISEVRVVRRCTFCSLTNEEDSRVKDEQQRGKRTKTSSVRSERADDRGLDQRWPPLTSRSIRPALREAITHAAPSFPGIQCSWEGVH